MGKSSPRNPLWPDWFDGEKIDEVTFCHELIRNHPMKCIENRFFTPDGPVEDEAELKQLILKEIQAFIIHGLSKKVSNLLESLRIIAYSAPLDIEVDCIHLKNGVYHLADGTFQKSRLFCRNRLPVAYNSKAAKPERWLTFLNELLEPEDIPTLQEYLGYCLIPCTKGQKMMFLLGKGGEGKSRIGLVLKNLMGDAVSNGSIQKVETSRFARADLENRLLMVDDDLNMNALPKTNYIKSIVTAEAKMQRANKDALEKLDPKQVYYTFPDRREGSKSSLILKKPKTKKSNRILYMTKPLKAELLAWLEKLKQDEQNAPEKYSNCGQLLPS